MPTAPIPATNQPRVINASATESLLVPAPGELGLGELFINHNEQNPFIAIETTAGETVRFTPVSKIEINSDIDIEISNTGVANPADPLSGDEFDLPSNAFNWARDNLICNEPHFIRFNIAGGVYEENTEIFVPLIGQCPIDVIGPDTGSSDPAVIIRNSTSNPAGFIIDGFNVTLRNFVYKPTANPNTWIWRAPRLIKPGKVIYEPETFGTGTLDNRPSCVVNVQANANGVPALHLKGAMLSNEGEILLGEDIEIETGATSTDVVLQNLATLRTLVKGIGKQITLSGPGRGVELVVGSALIGGEGSGTPVWVGDPVFTSVARAEMVPLQMHSKAALAGLETPPAGYGSFGVLNGQPVFWNGTTWKEITLGADAT